MSRNDKMKFICLIEGSELGIGDALAKYDVPRSTYYRWKRKLRTQGIKGLADNNLTGLEHGTRYCHGKLTQYWSMQRSILNIPAER